MVILDLEPRFPKSIIPRIT